MKVKIPGKTLKKEDLLEINFLDILEIVETGKIVYLYNYYDGDVSLFPHDNFYVIYDNLQPAHRLSKSEYEHLKVMSTYMENIKIIEGLK
jgi:hypothetical protein